MIEDEAHDATLVEHTLKEGGFNFSFRRVDTEEAFLDELGSFRPSVILSDHGLPAFDGFTALSIAQDKVPDVPFIFVTSALGEEMTISTFESGATDYVLKKDLSKLVPAVERALREAKERGVPISGEICPHHIALTDDALQGYELWKSKAESPRAFFDGRPRLRSGHYRSYRRKTDHVES